jgi:hypothetical protein
MPRPRRLPTVLTPACPSLRGETVTSCANAPAGPYWATPRRQLNDPGCSVSTLALLVLPSGDKKLPRDGRASRRNG